MTTNVDGLPIKNIAGPGRQGTVEAGDLVSVWFEDCGQLTQFTIASDPIDRISVSLLGKHLFDMAELEYRDLITVGKITAIIKTAGLVLVPPLGGVKEATIQRWHEITQRVSQGQLLVTLKAGERMIDVHAPIAGFWRGAATSAREGAITRAGNRLARIEYAPPPILVRYSLVKTSGLPLSLRIDYAAGYPVTASEWVCPEASGITGNKGRRWWLERNGEVPATPEMALSLAKTLPAPFQIDVERNYNVPHVPPTIKAFWYSSRLDGDAIRLSACNSIVLSDADREQLENLVIKTVDPFEFYPEFLCPPPSWWPELQGRIVALTRPVDRHSVEPQTKKIVRQHLEISRQRVQKYPNRAISTKTAIKHISMAYTLSEAPLPQEVCAFFSLVWPTNDLIFQNNRQELHDAIDKLIHTDWLSRIVDPLIASLKPTGYIDSGLRRSADGYDFGEAWIPCIDLSSLFEFLPEYPRPGRTDDLKFAFPVFDALHSMIRDAINNVRANMGLPLIGEGWLTETYLYHRIKKLLPNETVLHHGRPRWLGRQHFDIWLPDRNVAIEYQGEQHFVEVSLFGGKEALAKTQERDARKRRLCQENRVTLVEISFNDDLRDDWLISRLSSTGT